MNERLLKGKFLLSVLAVVLLFLLCSLDKMSGSEAGIAIAAIVTAFLHFDTKGPAQ